MKTETLSPDPRLADCELLTVKEVAALLKFHERTVWRLASIGGEFPRPIRVGGKARRWKLSDIKAYLGGNQS